MHLKISFPTYFAIYPMISMPKKDASIVTAMEEPCPPSPSAFLQNAMGTSPRTRGEEDLSCR